MASTVLLIDDDPDLLVLLQKGLEHGGFVVQSATGGLEGIRKAYKHHPDVIILDVVMTGMDGLETCRRLRQVCDTPILMLSGLSSTGDITRGLSTGADDYLAKPYDLSELQARVQALLRRSRDVRAPSTGRVYDDGSLRIDQRQRTVELEGRRVSLTPTEWRLLLYLVNQHGRVVPHTELMAHVWGTECTREQSCLSVYISYLRSKIELDPSAPRYIRTRRKLGYYFAAEALTRP
jgi:DNA-binding response OmpR family regulator